MSLFHLSVVDKCGSEPEPDSTKEGLTTGQGFGSQHEALEGTTSDKTPPVIPNAVEYIALLEDIYSEMIAQQLQLFGGSAASTLRVTCADRVADTLQRKEAIDRGIQSTIRLLRRKGFQASERFEDDRIVVGVTCPHAEKVHLILASRSPLCPLLTPLLCALRTEIPSADMRIDLMETGAEFTVVMPPRIAPKPEVDPHVAFRPSRGVEWSGLAASAPEVASQPKRETLTNVLVDNPWAVILSKRQPVSAGDRA